MWSEWTPGNCCGCTIWDHYDALAIETPFQDSVCLSYYPTPPSGYVVDVLGNVDDVFVYDDGKPGGSEVWIVRTAYTSIENDEFESIRDNVESLGYVDGGEAGFCAQSENGTDLKRTQRTAIRFDTTGIDTTEIETAYLYIDVTGKSGGTATIVAAGYADDEALPTDAAEFDSQSSGLSTNQLDVNYTTGTVENRIDLPDLDVPASDADTLTVYLRAVDYHEIQFRNPRLRVRLSSQGWRTINVDLPGQKLPGTGLYVLTIDPIYSGDYSASETLSCRLLKDDDTVFAEWSITETRYDANPIDLIGPEKTQTFAIDWNGTTDLVSDTRKEEIGSLLGDKFPYIHSVAVRPACGLFFMRDYSETVTKWALSDGDNPYYHFNPSNTAETTGQAIPAENIFTNDPGTAARFEQGFPLPLDEDDLANAGPLRLAIYDQAGSEFRVSAKAEKILQEEIAPAASGYEYGYGCVEQTEKNAACPHPTLNSSTHPNYAYPRWKVSSISGGGITWYGTQTFERSPAYVCHLRADTDINSNLGFDLEDFDLPTYTARQRYFATPATPEAADSPSAWVQDSPTVHMRVADVPFIAEFGVASTDDPCEWEVTAEIGVRAWLVDPSVTEAVLQFGGVLEEGLDLPALWGDYLPCPLPASIIDATNFAVHWFTFRKLVPAWDGQPPTISFDGANDLPAGISQPAQNIGNEITCEITEATSVLVVQDGENYYNVSVTGETTVTAIAVDPADMTFTISPATNLKVPHP